MEHRLGGPAFRWKRAQECAALPQPKRLTHLDEPTRQAAAYLRMCDRHGPERANSKYPLVAAACAVCQNDKMFEAFRVSLLGGLPSAELALRLDLSLEIIEVAEALFFDLGDQPQAAWISHHVVIPEVSTGSAEVAAKLKVAYHGGPLMARALLDAQDNLPLNDAQTLVDQELLLYAKLQAALEFELDAHSASEYIKHHLDYDLARRNIELEREKFQYECELARAQHAGNQDQQSADQQQLKDASPNDVCGEDVGAGERVELIASADSSTST